MKRATALVLIFAGLLAAGFFLRNRGKDVLSPPPVAPRPAPTFPPPATPPRPETAPPVPAENPGPPVQAKPFEFDDRRPLIDQIRPLLKAVDAIGPEAWRACEARAADVTAALGTLLKDASLSRNEREVAVGMLADLKVEAGLATLLDVARNDPDAGLRAGAIRAAGGHGPRVGAETVRGFFDGARSNEERIAALDVLGDLGEASTLPFLEATARSYPDTTVLGVAAEAARKVRIEHSPNKDVELTQILHQEEDALREWALRRIVAGKRPDATQMLRQVLDDHRRRAAGKAPDAFEVDLLKGLNALGLELSSADRKIVEDYGRPKGFTPRN